MRFHVILAAALAAACLAGCAADPRAPEPTIVTQRVEVPVSRPCVPADTAAAPSSYADDQLPKAPDAADLRYQVIAAANEQRRARLAQLEPIIKACR